MVSRLGNASVGTAGHRICELPICLSESGLYNSRGFEVMQEVE